MNRPKIYFITGVNTSGKSTLVPLLLKILPAGFFVRDFDARGVPKNVDEKWRQNTTKFWLEFAYRNYRRGISTVISGLAIPSEIHRVVRKTFRRRIKIAFLEVSAKQISKRLYRRCSTPAKVKNLKEVTGLTVTECIAANIKHAQVLRKDCKKFKCRTFNTSHVKVERTAAKVGQWIIAS